MSHPNLAGIKSVRLFSSLNEHDHKHLALIAERNNYSSGSYLCRENDPGSALFVIVSGNVRVLKRAPHSNEDEEIAELGAGTYVGISSMIDQGTRSASIQATEPTSVLTIKFEALAKVLDDEPEFAVRFWRAVAVGMARQLRSANRSHSLLKEMMAHRAHH